MILNKIKKHSLKPLPDSKIMAQSENYRIVQSYKYSADWCWQGADDPYKIIPYWYIEKKNKNAMGEIFWASYQNNPQTWGHMHSTDFLKEYFKLTNPDEWV